MLFGAFDVLIDFCANHLSVLNAGLGKLTFGIVLFDRHVNFVGLSLLTLTLEHLAGFEEIDGRECGIVCMIGGLFKVFQPLIELFVGHISDAECSQSIGRHRNITLRREDFEFRDGLFVIAQVEITQRCAMFAASVQG